MSESTIAPGEPGGGGGPSGSGSATADDLEWLSLDETESVLWAGGPDRRTIAPAVGSLLLPVLALTIVPFQFTAGLLAAGVLAVVTVPIAAWTVVYVRNTDYVVTTSGLYEKRGVLSRDVTRIDFEKIQNTSYNQSALGRRLGYGTVAVSSAGGSGVEMRFRSIPNPREIQQLISSRVTSARTGPGDGRNGSGGTADADVLEEILVELRAIRAALEDDEDETEDDGHPREQSSDSEPSTDETLTLERDSGPGAANAGDRE